MKRGGRKRGAVTAEPGPIAALVLACLLGMGCKHAPAPQPRGQLESPERFTCCNLHYEAEDVSDANYWTGHNLPAGTPVTIESIGADSVTFHAAELRITLHHEHATDEEPLSRYVEKVLTKDDPRPRLAAYSSAVRRAIAAARVERGMTRDQVLASLGYPPTHRTPSTQEREWTYWYNRWVTYKVVFDEAGKVADVIGRPAPTAEVRSIEGDGSGASTHHKKGKKKK